MLERALHWVLAVLAAIGAGLAAAVLIRKGGETQGADIERARASDANREAVAEAKQARLEGEEKAREAFERHQARVRDNTTTHADIEAAKAGHIQDPSPPEESLERYVDANESHREILERLKDRGE